VFATGLMTTPPPTTPAPGTGLPAHRAPARGVLDDAVRLAALDATDIRSAARAEALRPVVRLAARALRVSVAQINVVTADAQVPVVACAPSDPSPGRWEVPVGLDASYCQHVVTSGAPLLIDDARTTRSSGADRATTMAGIGAYAGVPVRAPGALGPDLGGQVLGSVCVVDFAPRRWSAEDLALLEDLAEAISAELGVRAEVAAEAAHEVAAVAESALRRADAALADSEGRFRTLADAIPQLAWMADAAGDIFWYNRRWYEYTGTALEQVRGEGWTAVHHPEHVERVTARFRAAVAAREPWEDTFPLRGRDGTYRWFLSRAVPVPADGTVRWFGTNTDITGRIASEAERERLLEAERDARQSAEEAGRARTRFLATMSHELRTPLNAIGGYVQLLDMGLRGPLTEAQRADLARITRSQQHLLGLINDVLNFARLDSGAVAFASDDVPAAAVIQDVSAMILPQASAKGLSYRRRRCPPTLAARADREKVRQVLLNLLSNAVKFTPAPGRVRLSCGAGDDTVRWVVQDTGVGIPADQRDAVFEPFVQVGRASNRPMEGTGLGLAISRDLARGMGGDLVLAPPLPDGGSVFVLTLPRTADLPADAGAAYAPEVPGAEAETAVRAILARAATVPGAHA
jgi:PAS domain S-box-containing protein